MTLVAPLHTIGDFFKARIPDMDKFLPGFNLETSTSAAKAFYWRKMFPSDLEPYNLNENRMTELQRTLVALKMAVSAVPQMLAAASSGASIVKAQSGQDHFQFEERVKYYAAMMKFWQQELDQMEASMGFKHTGAVTPGFRVVIQ